MQHFSHLTKGNDRSAISESTQSDHTLEFSSLKSPTLSRPVIVELGNAGYSCEGERNSDLLLRSAKRHRQWLHIGIDLKDFKSFIDPNITHKRTDFVSGLNSLEDASVAAIVSRFSVGYYTASGLQLPLLSPNGRIKDVSTAEYNQIKAAVIDYTSEIINICCDKLKPQGLIYFQVCKFVVPIISLAAQKSPGVKKVDILSCRNAPSSKLHSYWAKELGIDYRLFKVKMRINDLTA